MAQGFRIVFDLSTTPDRWWQEVGWIFALPIAGLLSIFIPQKIQNSVFFHGFKGSAGIVFGLAFFFVTGAFAVSAAVDHFQQKAAYRAMQSSGRLSFIEGCLRSFHAMPSSGHDVERIDVAGRQFTYSDFDESSPAFNTTEAHGGPIHADGAVRIWYVGNNIIKLAVRDHACQPALTVS